MEFNFLQSLTESDGRFTTTLKKEMRLKDQTVIPVGERVSCVFTESTRVFIMNWGGRDIKIPYTAGGIYLNKFKKVPSMKALEKMVHDGISTTPIGSRVEPDGHGPQGDPSWLLILGLI